MTKKEFIRSIPTPLRVSYANSLIVDGRTLKPDMPEEYLAKALINKYQNVAVVKANAPWLSKYFGPAKFDRIIERIEGSNIQKKKPVEYTIKEKVLKHIISPEQKYFFKAKVKSSRIVNGIKCYFIDFDDGVLIREEVVAAFPNYRFNHDIIYVAYDGNYFGLEQEWAYDGLFEEDEEYEFTVCSVNKSRKEITLIDKYENLQICNSNTTFSPGDRVVCTVKGLVRRNDNERCLVLTNPHKVADTEETILLNKVNDKYHRWYNRLHKQPKHLCGKAEICACCNKPFAMRKGYRYHEIEIYICANCYKEISSFKKKDPRKEWVRFINTNMGHKK